MYVNDACFTLLSIDPGNNLGLAISVINPLDKTMTVVFSITLISDKAIRYDGNERVLTLSRNERRERYLRPIITQLLEQYNVDAVIYESAFVAKSIVAYDSLKFYGDFIRRCSQDYYWDILLQTVSPSKVKKILGVAGNSGDKDLMTSAVANHPSIIFSDGINVADMTEHAIDAIAIGYVVLHEYIEQ